MKRIILNIILGTILVLFLHPEAKAQLSVNINLGSQPAWGPSGYNHVDYYYLPDIESYYDVTNGQYIYQDGGRWIFARTLPSRYRNYDLYSGYKVVVNRPKPYLNYSRDRVTYGKYKNWKGGRQPMLRETRNVHNRTVINNNIRVNRPGNNGNHFGNRPSNPGHGGMPPGQVGKPGRPGNPNDRGHNDQGRH